MLLPYGGAVGWLLVLTREGAVNCLETVSPVGRSANQAKASASGKRGKSFGLPIPMPDTNTMFRSLPCP